MKNKMMRGIIIVLAVVLAIGSVGAFAKIALSERYQRGQPQQPDPNENSDTDNDDQQSPDDKALEKQQWDEYIAARNIYYKAMKERKPEILIDLPFNIFNPIEARDVNLTKAAIEFFKATTDLEAKDMGEFFIVKPYGAYSINRPAVIDLWHKTSHYSGGIIAIVDAKDNLLAKYQLPEISSNNDIYQSLTVEISYQKPSTQTGYIIGYGWNTEKGEADISTGVKIPISFISN